MRTSRFTTHQKKHITETYLSSRVLTQAAIAKIYGCSQYTISLIVREALEAQQAGLTRSLVRIPSRGLTAVAL